MSHARSNLSRFTVDLQCLNRTDIKDYEINVLIGQGAFGVVKRATYRDEGKAVKVALKQYDKNKLYQDHTRVDALRKECTALACLEHPGIMKFYDSIDSGNKVNIVVEYINGNNLYQYIRKLPGSRIQTEDQVKDIFRQVVESVAYMHDQGVIHRDLKLENILMDRSSNKTKLIDFGFACKVKSAYQSKLAYLCGTPIYMSPELAQKKESIGGATDIWALGVILFILLCGKMPFHGAYEEDLFRKIISGKYQWPSNLLDKQGDPVEIGNGAKNLVRKIFQMDQNRRPTA